MSEMRNGTFELLIVTVCAQRFSELKSAKVFAATCMLTALDYLVDVDFVCLCNTLPSYSSPKCLTHCLTPTKES